MSLKILQLLLKILDDLVLLRNLCAQFLNLGVLILQLEVLLNHLVLQGFIEVDLVFVLFLKLILLFLEFVILLLLIVELELHGFGFVVGLLELLVEKFGVLFVPLELLEVLLLNLQLMLQLSNNTLKLLNFLLIGVVQLGHVLKGFFQFLAFQLQGIIF